MEARCIIVKGRRGVLKIDKKREMADIGSQMPAISRFWVNQRFLNVRREGEARKYYYDCHSLISSEKEEDRLFLYLLRTGSHSDLF